jgi:hypothetical protein
MQPIICRQFPFNLQICKDWRNIPQHANRCESVTEVLQRKLQR